MSGAGWSARCAAECTTTGTSSPKHFELDENAWDGSGIFTFYSFEYLIFVTEAVKEAMEAAGFTTVRFQESAPAQEPCGA